MMIIAGKETRSTRTPGQPLRLPGADRVWSHVEWGGIGLVIALGLILLLALHGASGGRGEPVEKNAAMRLAYAAADLRDVAHARWQPARLDHAARHERATV